MTPKESQNLVKALKKEGLLDSDGMMSRDPRRSFREYAAAARAALPEVYEKGGRDGLIPDMSATVELLNVAFCMHEITDEGLEETFTLFLKS